MSKKMFVYKLIIGISIIFLGINMPDDAYISYGGKFSDIEKYGGDAYTGIQNAAATTGNNVNELGDVIVEIYSNFMKQLGFTVSTCGALYTGYVVIDALDKKTKKEQV